MFNLKKYLFTNNRYVNVCPGCHQPFPSEEALSQHLANPQHQLASLFTRSALLYGLPPQLSAARPWVPPPPPAPRHCNLALALSPFRPAPADLVDPPAFTLAPPPAAAAAVSASFNVGLFSRFKNQREPQPHKENAATHHQRHYHPYMTPPPPEVAETTRWRRTKDLLRFFRGQKASSPERAVIDPIVKEEAAEAEDEDDDEANSRTTKDKLDDLLSKIDGHRPSS